MKKKIALLLSTCLFFNSLSSQNLGNNQKDSLLFSNMIKSKHVFKISESTYSQLRIIDSFKVEVIDDVVDYIQNNQDSIMSHYLLMMLRYNHSDVYAALSTTLKKSVLCSAFTKTSNVNYWGTSSRDNVGGYLIIDLGKPILPCLKPLLKDTTRMSYGWNYDSISGDVVEYKWRKKDFAYRYACRILKDTFVFPKSPEERGVKLI